MNRNKIADIVYTVIWSVVLCVYAVAVLHTNFILNPEIYDTDMYTDMVYAMKVWEEKTLFPAGWIFGNQLYVVATPVLAAVFMGLTGDPCVAMGIASTLMALGVMLSFYWMLIPVLPKVHYRLAAMVSFITIVLLSGDAIYIGTSWQLLFTMCSYYACYAITLFLAFGCYLRKDRVWSIRHYAMLILTCLMAIGTGMQSLRQTLIMVFPLIVAEGIRSIESLLRKEKFAMRPLVIAGSICISNLLGLLIRKLLIVEQISTTGEITVLSAGRMLARLKGCLINLFTLFRKLDAVAIVIVVLFLISLTICVFRKRSIVKNSAILCAVLLFVSVGGVLMINTCTSMKVRSIYYFVMYVLVAIAPVYAYSYLGKAIRISVATFLLLFVIVSCSRQLLPLAYFPQQSPRIDAVSNYLQEQGISTIYLSWNSGEEIAISSNFTITAGFWNDPEHPFEQMPFLCDPAIFEADPSECAYIFRGEDAATVAMEAAREMGTELILIKYFPEANFYVFTAPVNLMH